MILTIIITALLAATFSTTAIVVVYHRLNRSKKKLEGYHQHDDEMKDENFLIFDEPSAYKAADVKNDILYQRLKELMENDKPFLNPHIRMNDIATAIATNTSTLSNIINRRFNMSFTDMINSYRVRYALDYISKHPDISGDKLKIECGFNTTSTFTNAFHRHTGMTPGEYMKKYKAKL